jgi:predicted choloylglycine hydrolase
MKTLHELLSEETVNELQLLHEHYPHTLKIVLDELTTKHFFTDLTYHTVCILVAYLGLSSYGPRDVSLLFERNK